MRTIPDPPVCKQIESSDAAWEYVKKLGYIDYFLEYEPFPNGYSICQFASQLPIRIQLIEFMDFLHKSNSYNKRPVEELNKLVIPCIEAFLRKHD